MVIEKPNNRLYLFYIEPFFSVQKFKSQLKWPKWGTAPNKRYTIKMKQV